jgi:hypothetical protein
MAKKGQTSPWVYVGCGCGAAAILGVAALVGLLVFGARKAQELGEELKDPGSRQERVISVLGGDIPEGYYPVIGMEVPFIMEMAMLGDQPPGEDGELDDPMGERGFIYMRTRARKSKREKLEDFFEGRTNDLDALRKSNINLGRGEMIDRGAFELEKFGVRWIAQRGEVSMGRGRSSGITSVILVECPNDTSAAQRIGIWFGPEPASAEEGAEADLTGTPADEEALRHFLGHFAPCTV